MMRKKEMRKQLQETLDDLMEQDETIVVCDADLASSSGFQPLFEKYPQRSIDFGISETNMVGASAGLSQIGLKPIIHSFCPFVTRRVLDQLYVSVGFAQNNLFIYASDPGYWSQYNGATHTSFEDFAITRAIPGITVFAPSDARCVDWILRYYQKNPSFIYARIPRKEVPVFYAETEDFQYGKGKIVKEGETLAVICCGPELQDALAVAEELEIEQGISITVVDLLFIKPMDTKLLQYLARTHSAIITLENHNRYGGVGEAIASAIVEMGLPTMPHMKFLAVQDRYSEVGDVSYLKTQLHISKKDLKNACLEVLKTQE